MATSSEGLGARAEPSQVASTEPTALGGGGKNHVPPRIAPWESPPCGAPRNQGRRQSEESGQPRPPEQVPPPPPPKKISLCNFVTKSRSGYSWGGWAIETQKTHKRGNNTTEFTPWNMDR